MRLFWIIYAVFMLLYAVHTFTGGSRKHPDYALAFAVASIVLALVSLACSRMGVL